MEGGMKSSSKSMDDSMSGGSGSKTTKSDAPKATTSPSNDNGQQLFGNVASKLGMSSRRGKQAAALDPNVKLSEEQQAMLLLDEGQTEEAQKAFEAIVAKQPGNVVAQDALGCLALFANNRDKAAGHFEKAAAAKPGDRVAAIDLAALKLDDDPMQSVRLLRAYLSSGGPLDEQGQNAFGTALTRADHKQGSDRVYLLESRDFYFRYDQRLNAARTDGMKHWGNQWVDAATADAKWAALLTPGYALEQAHEEWPKLTATRQKTWANLQNATRNVLTSAAVNMARENFDAASKAEQDLIGRIRDLDAQLDKTELPPVGKMIEVVLPQ